MVRRQQNKCVRKNNRRSETSDMHFYSVIFSHIVHFLPPLAGGRAALGTGPLHGAALIYECNKKSAKLWWSIRQRWACQQSAWRLPEVQHLLAGPPFYRPSHFLTEPHCFADRPTSRMQIFFTLRLNFLFFSITNVMSGKSLWVYSKCANFCYSYFLLWDIGY